LKNDPDLYSRVLYTEFHAVEKLNLGMKWWKILSTEYYFIFIVYIITNSQTQVFRRQKTTI
jgi:hypothetical protein